MPAGKVPPVTMSRGPASVPQDGGAHTVNRVSRDKFMDHWEGAGAAQPSRGSPLLRSQKAYLILHFPQPVHVAGLERPVLSVATARLVPPATMSLESATVHPASLGLAVSRVGAPPTPALWRGTTGGFLRVRPGLTQADLFLACQPGTFGKDCEHPCQCPGETWACHPASGACVCAAGYHGTDCQPRESGDLGFCLPFWYVR